MMRSLLSSIGISLRSANDAWNTFWFHPIDPFGLSVIRILAGSMLLYTHLVWSLVLHDFLGTDGWNQRSLVAQVQDSPFYFSFWWVVPEDWMTLVHWGCNAILLLFALGCFTRITSIAAWIIAVSYANRAFLSTYGLDQINSILVFYLAIAPSGQCLSIDAWWRARRLGSQQRHSNERLNIKRSVLANLATRMIQVHLCVIYFFSGVSKLQGEAWWDGNAMWQAIANYEYQSIDLTFLAGYPWILHAVTHLTILWEVSFAAAVWPRSLKWLVLSMGVAMHLGIGAFLGMWTFGLAMTFGYLSFVPPEALRRFLALILRVPSLVQENQISNEIAVASASTKPTEESKLLDSTAASIVESTSFHAASIEAIGGASPSIDGPSQKRIQPSLILVARTATLRMQIFQYFERYSDRVSLVSGFVEAGELAATLPDPIVVDADSLMTEAELDLMMQLVRSKNSMARFVLVGQDPNFASHQNSVIVVEQGCSLRQIRTAVEELTGYTFEKRSGRVVQRERNDMQRYLGGLILIAMLVGCAPSSDTALLLEKARLLNDRGRSDEAMDSLNRVLKTEPKNFEAFYLKGVAFEQQSELKKAKEAYDACLSINASHALALNNRGVVLAKLGEMDQAVSDLQKALAISPDDALAWSNLGLAQHDLGRSEEALESYSHAIRLKRDPKFLLQKGNVYLDADRLKEAEEAFTESLSLDPQQGSAYLNRATVHYRLQQWDAARADLLAAEKHDQDLSLAPLVKNLLQAIDQPNIQSRVLAKVQNHLEETGWKLVETKPPYPLTAVKEGIERSVVIIQRDAEKHLLCPAEVAGAATKVNEPLILVVVDLLALETVPLKSIHSGAWLVHENVEWRSHREDFQPFLVRMREIPEK